MSNTHEGAARTVSQLYQRYGDHPNVGFQFIDNRQPEPGAGTIALTRKQSYRGTSERLNAILESKRSGIPSYIYNATKGAGN
jgi:hypothetical protein